MEEILSKRIILLTNAMIVLSCLGFLALIHRVDASYKAKEYLSLNRLRNCIEQVPKDADHQEVAFYAAKDWLMNNKPEVFAQNQQLADSFALQLDSAGFGQDVIAIKQQQAQPDATPGFMLINVISTDTERCDMDFGDLNGNHRLNFFAQQYRKLLSPVKFVVVTGMMKSALPFAMQQNRALQSVKSADKHSLPQEFPMEGDFQLPMEQPELLPPPPGKRPHNARIERVAFENDSLRITFVITSGLLQTVGDEELSVPVKTTVVNGPTWMDLYGFDPDYKTLGKKVELQKLIKHYGDLPMDKVVDMIGNDYMEAYERIDIFGFSFSSTSLPLALLAFFLFLSTGLYLMVREAKRKSLKVLSEFNNEEITDYFVKNVWIRTVLWLILPIGALVATLPVLPEEAEKLAVLITGGVVLAVINCATLLLARKI